MNCCNIFDFIVLLSVTFIFMFVSFVTALSTVKSTFVTLDVSYKCSTFFLVCTLNGTDKACPRGKKFFFLLFSERAIKFPVMPGTDMEALMQLSKEGISP